MQINGRGKQLIKILQMCANPSWSPIDLVLGIFMLKKMLKRREGTLAPVRCNVSKFTWGDPEDTMKYSNGVFRLFNASPSEWLWLISCDNSNGWQKTSLLQAFVSTLKTCWGSSDDWLKRNMSRELRYFRIWVHEKNRHFILQMEARSPNAHTIFGALFFVKAASLVHQTRPLLSIHFQTLAYR